MKMRESTKWTVGYQYRVMFLENIKAIGIIFAIVGLALYMIMVHNVIKEIVSVFTILCYFAALYSKAHKLAITDMKNYSSTNPNKTKAIGFGVVISLSFLLMLLINKYNWQINGTSGYLDMGYAWVLSIIFWIYTSPYMGIMGLSQGNIMWYSGVLMIVVPIIATTLGYFAGLKKIYVSDYIGNFQYEKK